MPVAKCVTSELMDTPFFPLVSCPHLVTPLDAGGGVILSSSLSYLSFGLCSWAVLFIWPTGQLHLLTS
jgi:hypothetical protein